MSDKFWDLADKRFNEALWGAFNSVQNAINDIPKVIGIPPQLFTAMQASRFGGLLGTSGDVRHETCDSVD